MMIENLHESVILNHSMAIRSGNVYRRLYLPLTVVILLTSPWFYPSVTYCKKM